MKEQLKQVNFFDILGVLLGVGIYSLAISAINIPNKLADGGLTGIALILKNLWGISPSFFVLTANLPLLVIAFLFLGRQSILKTIVGMGALSFFLFFWEKWIQYPLINSLWMASFITGFLSGLGCGIVFRFGGSTGGTDIVYQLLEKYFGIKIGNSLFFITSFILSASLAYLDVTHFLFTLISCFIFSRTLNFVKYF